MNMLHLSNNVGTPASDTQSSYGGFDGTPHRVSSSDDPHGGLLTPFKREPPTSNSGIPLQNLDISQICSRPLFEIIMKDYLEILYPLVPAVHRPTFLSDLEQHREATDATFFAVVVSIIATIVSILPRKFYEYQQFEHSFRFASRKEMVEECHRIILRTRDVDYMDNLTREKWAVAYFLALAHGHMNQFNRFRILNSEAIMILWTLKCHLVSGYQGLDYIEIQLRRKSFWLTFSSLA